MKAPLKLKVRDLTFLIDSDRKDLLLWSWTYMDGKKPSPYVLLGRTPNRKTAPLMTLGRAVLRVKGKGFRVFQKNLGLDYRAKNLEIRPEVAPKSGVKNIVWRRGRWRVELQFARKEYYSKGFKTIALAVEELKRLKVKAQAENPHWPPSREGEMRRALKVKKFETLVKVQEWSATGHANN